MDIIIQLKQIVKSKWLWLRYCLWLRETVQALVDALNHSPAQSEIVDLKAARDNLEVIVGARNCELLKFNDDNRQLKEQIAELQLQHTKEVDNTQAAIESLESQLKEARAKNDAMQATHKDAVDELNRQHGESVDALEKQLAEAVKVKPCNGSVKELQKEVEELKDRLHNRDQGNRALLKFLHTGNRLNTKFDPGSIQAAMAKSRGKV